MAFVGLKPHPHLSHPLSPESWERTQESRTRPGALMQITHSSPMLCDSSECPEESLLGEAIGGDGYQ